MIQGTGVAIIKIEDYNNLLLDSIPKDLVDEDVINTLKEYVGLKCDTIIVEYPYYDSDYLSAYYGHYSQKFKKYDKCCCRLHFERQDTYYGYITLRPTVKGTKLGKTYLSPELLLEKEAYLMQSEYIVNIMGQTLKIKCFPWKRQQTDFSVCAHSATWTVMRYFGNKYKSYADTTIGSIVEKTDNDWGRKIPSLGLSPVQISDVFKKYGMCPLILGGEKRTDFLFADEIIAYVESGLPMVGFLSPIEHAISIIGHGKIRYELLDNADQIDLIADEETGIIPHARLIESLYVMDDRFFPYMEMPVSLPTSINKLDYGMNQLLYAVVPLYSRMQLAYCDVYTRFITWVKDRVMNWERKSVCRIYITSSNSLKREAFKSRNMPQMLKEILLSLSMPKFVWCIDLAGIGFYKKGLTSGRIIIDATSATWDSEPWILRHDMNKIQYRDFDENPDIIYEEQVSVEPYDMYINNLTHFGQEIEK